MSNIKRPDSISGYVHPTTSNYSKNSVYKTFSEGTNEKFESTLISISQNVTRNV